MGVPGFLLGLLREAPNRRRLIRSLALGNQGGDRRVTSADGTSLSVRTSGSGTPLVLVHGILDGIGAFSLIELELAEDHLAHTFAPSVFAEVVLDYLDRRSRRAA